MCVTIWKYFSRQQRTSDIYPAAPTTVPSYSHKKLARMAAGSIGGASAHKTIMFHPEFQPNGSNKEYVIVRAK